MTVKLITLNERQTEVFKMFKFIVVSLGCAMFALLIRSAYDEKKGNKSGDLVGRLRKSGW